jgi:hypothetical protein
MSGVALPRNGAHVNCVRKSFPALKKLRIEVFWVLPNKKVEIESIWRLWDASATGRERPDQGRRQKVCEVVVFLVLQRQSTPGVRLRISILSIESDCLPFFVIRRKCSASSFEPALLHPCVSSIVPLSRISK